MCYYLIQVNSILFGRLTYILRYITILHVQTLELDILSES